MDTNEIGVPDYEIHSYLQLGTISFYAAEDTLEISGGFAFENTGIRPIAISRMEIVFEFQIAGEPYVLKEMICEEFLAQNLIVKRGDIWNGKITFRNSWRLPEDFNNFQRKLNDNRHSMKCSRFELVLANGNKLYPELEMKD